MAKLSDMRVEMEHNQGYSVVNPMVFYRDLFGDGFLEGHIERYKEMVPCGYRWDSELDSLMPAEWIPGPAEVIRHAPASNHKVGVYYPTAIAYERKKRDKPKLKKTASGKEYVEKHYIGYCHITNELDTIEKLLKSKNFIFMRPIGFIGPRGTKENARWLFALTVEIDKPVVVADYIQEGIRNLLEKFTDKPSTAFNGRTWDLPRPTYLVLSGSGVHLYYIFDHPLPMYSNVVDALSVYKKNLTTALWSKDVTEQWREEDIEYEPIWQPFRLVGGVTKNGGRTRAYKIGEKVSIEYLNQWAVEYKAEIPKSKSNSSGLSLIEAKEKYPNWYQQRIIEGKERGYYTLNRAVYDRWKDMILEKAKDGTRYWCLVGLTVYAQKCDIEWEELEADAFGMLDYFDSLTQKEGNEFTEDDVTAATRYHDSKRMKLFPKKEIEHLTHIKWGECKRNGRKQAVHLRRERNDYNAEHPNWQKNNPGAPTKANIVKEWRKEHPNGTQSECAREKGLSRTTVIKWWNAT